MTSASVSLTIQQLDSRGFGRVDPATSRRLYFHVVMDELDTIDNLKHKICDRIGVAPERQTIYNNYCQPEDGWTIADYIAIEGNHYDLDNGQRNHCSLCVAYDD